MRARHLFLLLALCSCASERRPPWADGAVMTSRVSGERSAQDLSNLPARLLALHNRERAERGIPPLSWSGRLAADAAAYGPALDRLGRLAHSPRESRPGQGENLWMGTAGAFSLEEMIGGWAGEKRLFRAGLFPDVSRNGHWADVAHYAQMIWRDTREVGCALYRGRANDILICRYAPAGNVVGSRAG